MLFKEGNDPFSEVIQTPNSVRHAVAMILPNHPATEEFLQRVKELRVTFVLNDREFGEHLKLAGHFWMRVDADIETTFAVNKTDHPLGL